MLNHRWLLPIVFAASALLGFGAAAQGSHCTAALGAVEVRGNLDVTSRCQLNGTAVRGNVTLFSGGSLIARDVSIRGNLTARRADFVAIEGSEIDGNVTLEELVGDNSSIESAGIRGNVTLASNRSAFEILNNEIGGNVRVSGNAGGVSISGNAIDGHLECSENTPAPVGVGNQVEKESRGQCQNLRPESSSPPPTAEPSPPPTPPAIPPQPATPAPAPPAPPAPPTQPPTLSSPPSVAPATPPPSTIPTVSATPPLGGSSATPPNPPPATTPPPVSGNSGSRDTTPPTLALRGAPNVTVTIDSTYADAGATATDSTDGDLTSRIVVVNPVNTALLGRFTITYSVSDLAGNAATPVTRTVTVAPQPAAGGGGGGAVGWPFALLLLPLLVGQYLVRRKNAREETSPKRIPVHSMRILFICDHLGYSGGGWNGCMTYFRNVLPQLQQEGHTVALCVLRGEHQAQDILRALGIPVISLDAARASPVTLLFLMRKILREDLEIIHSAQRESSWHARVLGVLLRRPSIVHLVDSQPVSLAQRIINRAMPQPDVALCVSGAIRSFASDAYGIAAERVCVLHNALDVAQVKPRVTDARDRLRRAWDVAADAPVVVSTSRFTPEKRLDVLIRMIPRVLVEEPRIKFIFAGSGPDLETCRDLAERLGVTAAVRFLGHRGDIPDVLAASDVTVMLCLREAFGYSALEAMASNLPVLAFKGCGLAEVVTDGVSGLLAPSADDACFLTNMLRVVSDERLRATLGARARIDARRFDVRFHTETLCRIYRHLVQPMRQRAWRSRAH